ncbi:hypothetical protein SERLADRAFT_436510 [Serpula lacrymans var. lacrymans S7.9]|uniref:Peptidase M20 domain-containing protein 2 n=1 Tax=Serpula lacrymans var. lacrymans (strain S7.9) TaxID=578457 RepID=F8NR49_SERL9|nr:uncharacterized protein SERLADRAFT_436510 [Serpula lacrymans var. lacrymans S7.9]EGO26698.1 hypothetical protein SERLADRAFT_436510 [Serpula lacrymans var. lacrymans S7.9]
MALDTSIIWRPEDDPLVRPPLEKGDVYRPDILKIVEATIDGMSEDLRNLSLDIHDHPEIKFEEKYAHDAYTGFMEKMGFVVTRNFHLPTAWVATYTHGQGGRVLGINSEVDALPGIGHACGHNLIGIAGVAVACGAKAALQQLGISGKIVLLGTPGEEGGFGKNMLLEKGAYEEMDVCLMCHPAPGPRHSISLSSSLALSRVEVEFRPRFRAHAALSPWEGKNAQDAAVSAYNNIALLRQQIKPTHRVHGIFDKGKDWAVNIIPDNSKMSWYVRAPTTTEAQETTKRVIACFEAAAIATGCSVKIDTLLGCSDIRQNKALGDELADVTRKRYGAIDYEWGIHSASTDFGDITYALPSLHPGFSIPTVPDGGNHTPAFTDAARTEVSHNACLVVSKALTAVGMRVLTDDAFLSKAKETFEEGKISMNSQ